jgi:diadenylate cyclase
MRYKRWCRRGDRPTPHRAPERGSAVSDADLALGSGGFRFVDAIDILIVALLCWLIITWAREARARVALGGVVAVAGLFGLATWLDLRLTTWILEGFIAIAALVVVIVFQDDLRRFFEGITLWVVRNVTPRPSNDVLDHLGDLCFALGRERIGSIFVFPGREPLDRLLDGGQYLDGRVSEPLLRSLLDPGTPGHDGAIVIRGGKVTRFGVHLPLSTEWSEIGPGGTRHAAALGLAERSDAFCIVISEERGEVSVAWRGRLSQVDSPKALRQFVERFLERTARRRREPWLASRLHLARRNWREGLAATALAVGMWIHIGPGATLDRGSRTVPVVLANLPEGYRVEAIEPPMIDVEFEARRRDFVMARDEGFEVRLDADLVGQGRRTFEVEAHQIHHPPQFEIVEVHPAQIRLRIAPL